MNKLHMNKKWRDWLFWISISVIGVGQAALIWFLATKNVSAIGAATLILGTVLPALGFLYEQLKGKSLRFFLLANQVKSLFDSRALTWDFSAVYSGENITTETLNRVVTKLLESQSDPTACTVKSVSGYNKIVDIASGPKLDLEYNPPPIVITPDASGPFSPQMHLSIRNYRIGYSQASHAIRQEIAPVLETIADVVRADSSKYSLVVEFDTRRNPFFGLYIAQLPLEAISKFYVRLVIKDKGLSGTVLISETNLSINTYSQATLQNLALEFLTFDAKLRDHLVND